MMNCAKTNGAMYDMAIAWPCGRDRAGLCQPYFSMWEKFSHLVRRREKISLVGRKWEIFSHIWRRREKFSQRENCEKWRKFFLHREKGRNMYIESVCNSLFMWENISYIGRKLRKNFSPREKTVRNREEFSHMWRRGKNWRKSGEGEKNGRKSGEGKRIAHPAYCYCQSQMVQSCKWLHTFICIAAAMNFLTWAPNNPTWRRFTRGSRYLVAGTWYLLVS